MFKQRKWLIAAAMLIIVGGLYPYLGLAEGESQGEETAATAVVDTADSEAVADAVETDSASEPVVIDAAADTGSTDSEAVQTEVPLTAVTATTKVSENDKYELYIDEKTGNVRVVEKSTQQQWLGSPQVPKTTMPNNKKFMDSPAHVKYTLGADTTSTYTLKEKENKFEIEKTDYGAKVTFHLKEEISFALEYRLTNDGLEVTIPDDAIKEEGQAKLLSIEPLPFWNAASGDEKGALFVPDGSGALITYKKEHAQFFAGYSQTIYGDDDAYVAASHTDIDSEWERALPFKEKIALPVFGNYRNGIGSLGIVTQGQYDAKINATPSGIRAIPMYRTSTEFIYRKQDVIFIGTSGQIPFFQGDRIPGDRKVRFVTLEGQDANYVGLAKAYRNYLTTEQNVQQVEQDGYPISIKLFGGLIRDDLIGSTFIKMTTFEQAKTIIDAYASKGMTNLELTFEGWSDEGMYGDQPDHFPVEKSLGGSKDLKELAAYAKQKGVKLYLQANYARAYSESDGMSKSKDAIRGMDKQVKEDPNYYISERWNKDYEMFYLMKPERVVDKHVMKELDNYADLGVDGVQLSYWGDMLYSDLDPRTLTQREQTASAWVSALDAIRGKVGSTGVDYGFAYTLGHVNRIENVPLDSSHFIMMDETVPFYQIAVHGLVPYSASPINLRDDAEVEKLRALEYGALPSLELTYEETSKLQRTLETRLLSSQYTSWIDKAASEYKESASYYESIAGKAITNHEKLSSDVSRTTYEGGTQIIVNYGDADAIVDGVSVPALGYTVRNGGQ
ncbi:hypothetical protein DFQ01_13643 [Paenibacillus cellulosilyticus]|uniref:Glycosyl hydrolase family 101 n=1 Tax=Paenibacillus cellulosilyticus TaxID=375489 RepID=A0A2V2YGS9_9BACL|nr:DUF5696 domain-containing protein [Paenibacillus cellulosilyticus]PWV92097.1 hypothetical protein DFQ01_13643 [Paenibacillus cellulosilyticus]QKS44207.1 hypothetical protein HUB94_07055 [Paenibacillus cellulosilyticus]